MSACPSCSRDVAEGFAFCPHCGASLTPDDSSQEERKLVTLLFADVTGSTRLSEELDAEVVRELMGAYFALAREEIEARGGTVEKFIGDAVMASSAFRSRTKMTRRARCERRWASGNGSSS